MRLISTLIASFFISLFFISSGSSAASNVLTNSYATTNVTTSAYVTLGNAPVTSGILIVCDNSGHIIKVAFGSVGNEVDQFTAPLNACLYLTLTNNITAGVRVSLKAVDASATTGYSTVSFLP